MEKTLAVTERAKGSNPIVIQFPMLTATNYTVWAKRMTVTLRCHKVWDVIEPGVDDEDKNNSAIALLFQSIPESLILQLDHDKAKDLWEAIKNRYLGANRVREARLQTLSSEFEKLSMTESEDIEGFAGRISSIASRSSALGQNIEEQKMVKKILNGVPKNKYIQLVASLEQVLDLSTTTFEDIVGRLKAYEERIRVDDQSSDQGNLLFTSNSQNSRERFGEPRGRGRGNHGRGRGRGRGRGFFNDNQEQKQENTRKHQSEVICWRCDKPGHVVYNCPDRPQHVQETNLVEAEETQEADVALFMHETVFLNEEVIIPRKHEEEKDGQSIWYLDNGASNHMTCNRSYFSELNEDIKGKVKFGDESCIDIMGKGSIIFQAITGEQRLISDVYWIPDLKSNIISLGQATEAGCDVRLKEKYLTMHDHDGNLLMKVERSLNRMYKIRLLVGTPVRLLEQRDDEIWRWPTKLGYVDFSSMKMMSKKKLVRGLSSFGEEKRISRYMWSTLLKEKSNAFVVQRKSLDDGIGQYPAEEEPPDQPHEEDTETTEAIDEFSEFEENCRDTVGTREDPFQQPDEPRMRR